MINQKANGGVVSIAKDKFSEADTYEAKKFLDFLEPNDGEICFRRKGEPDLKAHNTEGSIQNILTLLGNANINRSEIKVLLNNSDYVRAICRRWEQTAVDELPPKYPLTTSFALHTGPSEYLAVWLVSDEEPWPLNDDGKRDFRAISPPSSSAKAVAGFQLPGQQKQPKEDPNEIYLPGFWRELPILSEGGGTFIHKVAMLEGDGGFYPRSKIVKAFTGYSQTPTLQKLSEEAAQGVMPFEEYSELSTTQRKRDPHPIHAYPALIREAAEEITYFLRTPPEMAPMAMMAVLSAIIQGLANVERPGGLFTLLSIWHLIIAKSGERKSAVDKIVCWMLRQFQVEQRKKYKQEFAAWKQRQAALDRIDGSSYSQREIARARLDAETANDELKKLEKEVAKLTKAHNEVTNNLDRDAVVKRLNDATTKFEAAKEKTDKAFSKLNNMENSRKPKLIPIENAENGGATHPQTVGLSPFTHTLAIAAQNSAIAPQGAQTGEKGNEDDREPRYVILLRKKNTVQGLTNAFIKSYPVAATIVGEGGSVFGGYAMQPERVMETLSFYNEIWSGEETTVTLKNETQELYGVRYSQSLMVQHGVIRSFHTNQKNKDMPEGMGFWARFFFAEVESTVGTRKFREPIPGEPATKAFHARIKQLLELPVPLTEENMLDEEKMTLLKMSPAAQREWIRINDEFEEESGPGGKYESIQGMANKGSENVARVAALFHVLEYDLKGEISEEHVRNAGHLVRWYLNEGLRIFGEMNEPEEIRNAIALSKWLVTHAKKRGGRVFNRRDVMIKCNPKSLRTKKVFGDTLNLLKEYGHIRMLRGEKEIEINAELVRENNSTAQVNAS